MEPKVVQDFFLLSINPKNGYYFNFGNEFTYGLMGALVLDLYRLEKINFQNKSVFLVDQSSTDYPFFNRAIELIKQKRTLLNVYGLISRIGFRYRIYKKEIVGSLLQNKIIIKVRKKFLFIPYNRYYPFDRDRRFSIIRRYRDILLRNEMPETDDLYLLSLIHATGLYKALSDQRAERKVMRTKMKLLLQKDRGFNQKHENIVMVAETLKRVIIAKNAAQHAH